MSNAVYSFLLNEEPFDFVALFISLILRFSSQPYFINSEFQSARSISYQNLDVHEDNRKKRRNYFSPFCLKIYAFMGLTHPFENHSPENPINSQTKWVGNFYV